MEFFKYKVNGIELGYEELKKIDEYYEACCSAEWFQELAYEAEEIEVSNEDALEIGYLIRRSMFDDDSLQGEIGLAETVYAYKVLDRMKERANKNDD